MGNQTTRPGGTSVSHTPFDLPTAVKQAKGTVTFGYDGDEKRIRKTTPDEGALYFGELYKRVTEAVSRRQLIAITCTRRSAWSPSSRAAAPSRERATCTPERRCLRPMCVVRAPSSWVASLPPAR